MVKRILVLAANPKNTSRLRLDEEVRGIAEGLERSSRRDEFELSHRWATRPIDVRRAMLDFNPNIVHFCGHGGGQDGLAFEDETGQTKLVDAYTLAEFFELFSRKGVECIVLNACYSEIQAEAIKEHIDYVIGMSRSIGDSAAIVFAVAFYDALGAGKTVEFAYKLACNAIRWSGVPEHLTPVLKSKTPSQTRVASQTETEGPEVPEAREKPAAPEPVMHGLDSDLPASLSWLSSIKMPDPLGEDVLVFDSSVGVIIDPHAHEWVDVGESGEYESIEGPWRGRWYRTDDHQLRHEGAAHVFTVGEWIYIYYTDATNQYLIKAKMKGKRLIGRYVNLGVKQDSSPWVGVVVNNRRIDGRYLGGCWDFRR